MAEVAASDIAACGISQSSPFQGRFLTATMTSSGAEALHCVVINAIQVLFAF
jgi:hypothetical protein